MAASSACAAEKHQRDVDADPFARQRLARPDAVAGERHLDDHVLVELRDFVSLAHHAVELGRDHFAADRPLHDVADLLQFDFVVAGLLRQQRRIGGDAVDDADRDERLDLLDAAAVYESFIGA